MDPLSQLRLEPSYYHSDDLSIRVQKRATRVSKVHPGIELD